MSYTSWLDLTDKNFMILWNILNKDRWLFLQTGCIRKRYNENSQFKKQCSKLRVHPAPGVHISAAGCTIFGGVHPECARFFEYLSLLHTRRVHGKISGCAVL